jgi:hypothetical protein
MNDTIHWICSKADNRTMCTTLNPKVVPSVGHKVFFRDPKHMYEVTDVCWDLSGNGLNVTVNVNPLFPGVG